MHATTVREAAAEPSAEQLEQREKRWQERQALLEADPTIAGSDLCDLFLDRNLIDAQQIADLMRIPRRQLDRMIANTVAEPELAGQDADHMIEPDGFTTVDGEVVLLWENGRAAEYTAAVFARKYSWGTQRIRFTKRELLEQKEQRITAELAARREREWQTRLRRIQADTSMPEGQRAAYTDRTLVDTAGAAKLMHTTAQRVYEMRTLTTAEPQLAGLDSQHMLHPDAFEGSYAGKATKWMYETGRILEFAEKIANRIWWNALKNQHEPNTMTSRHGRAGTGAETTPQA